jgi:hypothetical protein
MSAGPKPEHVGTTPPKVFADAVDALRAATVRNEIELEELPPPQRLAPWAYAVGATVVATGTDDEIGSGRLVLLHDPAGVEAWDGNTRYVVFISCEVEGEIARDPLLPDVAWSWLLDALNYSPCEYGSLGGTVTATTSLRFGDIASSQSRRTDDVEIRASWTAVDDERVESARAHLTAFTDLLSVAAGLAPEGVATISSIRPDHRS